MIQYFLDNFENEYFASKWYENFVKTYIERDLPLLGFHTDPIKLEKIIRIVASLHGQILNYSNIARAVDFSVPNVTRIINILEHAYVLITLPPFYLNIKKRLVKSPKIYIRDSGILHYFLNKGYSSSSSLPLARLSLFRPFESLKDASYVKLKVETQC